MGDRPDLAEVIKLKYPDMTEGQQVIARYILDNLADTAFMTIQDLAEECGVSEASIVRFARLLGYNGFPDLKSDIQEAFRTKVNIVTKLGRKLEKLHGEKPLVKNLIENELQQINKLLLEPLDETFSQCIKAIAGVETLVIYGEGSSASLTVLLEFRLRRFKYTILRINENGKDFFEKVVHFPKNAVAIAFGLGRPSEELVIFLQQARKNGCKSILITDSHISSISQLADYVLSASRGSLGMFHSVIIPTIISEALILGVALERREEVLAALSELESLRSVYGYPKLAGLEKESLSKGR